jgi:hypothetical protein
MSPVSCPLSPGLGLFLHASSVVVEGGALLFLGHSTAGKSTMARLLGARFPVLADDSVFAFPGADGDWRVVDGGFRFGEGSLAAWHERIHRHSNECSVPLRGCLRLHKGPAVRVEPLAPVELARHLMDAAMEIDVQRKFGRFSPKHKPECISVELVREMRRTWIGHVADIARICPGGHLWFPKEPHLTELCEMLASLASAGRILG